MAKKFWNVEEATYNDSNTEEFVCGKQQREVDGGKWHQTTGSHISLTF